MVWEIRPVTERERKRDLAGDKERERGTEIWHPCTLVGDREREEEKTGRNTWYSGRISLCIRPETERPSLGFHRILLETSMTSPDPAGNPHTLAWVWQIQHSISGILSHPPVPVIPIPLFRLDAVFSSRPEREKEEQETFLSKNPNP